MDHSFIRGAAAALFVVGTAAPHVGAQVAAGSIQVRGTQRDSFVVRVIDPTVRAKIDSMMVIMRDFYDMPATSDDAVRLRREYEALFRALSAARGMGGPNRVIVRGQELPQVHSRLKGWIGINPGFAPQEQVVDSTGFFVHYFRYPSIVSVEPNSPAQRAGIAPGDVLVAYDGQDVVRGRVNMAELLVPERKLDVTVHRDGVPREFSLTVVKTPDRIMVRRAEPNFMIFASPDMPGGGVVARGLGPPPEAARRGAIENVVRIDAHGGGSGGGIFTRAFVWDRSGVLGTALVTVNAELARAMKLEKGVLVQECIEQAPAFKSGIRTGDIIVAVAGQQVNTVGDVITMVQSRSNEKSAAFQVIRDKKPVTLTVKW